MQDRELDGLIESSLLARVEGVAPPGDMFGRIRAEIHRGMNADVTSRRASFSGFGLRFGLAKPVLAGVCCIVLAAGTAFADPGGAARCDAH